MKTLGQRREEEISSSEERVLRRGNERCTGVPEEPERGDERRKIWYLQFGTYQRTVERTKQRALSMHSG
jgi:hypothetical protein